VEKEIPDWLAQSIEANGIAAPHKAPDGTWTSYKPMGAGFIHGFPSEALCREVLEAFVEYRINLSWLDCE